MTLPVRSARFVSILTVSSYADGSDRFSAKTTCSELDAAAPLDAVGLK
jgi:hypothetical protein